MPVNVRAFTTFNFLPATHHPHLPNSGSLDTYDIGVVYTRISISHILPPPPPCHPHLVSFIHIKHNHQSVSYKSNFFNESIVG